MQMDACTQRCSPSVPRRPRRPLPPPSCLTKALALPYLQLSHIVELVLLHNDCRPVPSRSRGNPPTRTYRCPIRLGTLTAYSKKTPINDTWWATRLVAAKVHRGFLLVAGIPARYSGAHQLDFWDYSAAGYSNYLLARVSDCALSRYLTAKFRAVGWCLGILQGIVLPGWGTTRDCGEDDELGCDCYERGFN